MSTQNFQEIQNKKKKKYRKQFCKVRRNTRNQTQFWQDIMREYRIMIGRG